MKRQILQYDSSVIKNDIVMLTEAFTELEFSSPGNQGHASKKPIFIVGMPRTGTTLVEQIVSSHPQVYGGGELDALDKTVPALYPLVDMNATRGQRLQRIDKNTRIKAASSYLKQLPKPKGNEKRITDKMPHNVLHIGWINLIFNTPGIIYVKREKMATVFSCYQQYFANGNEYAYDLRELSEYYDSYDLLMRHWTGLFGEKIYTVNYEDLVSNQEAVTQKLIDFCGLAWSDKCLSFDRNRRTVTTLSTSQVRQPIYTKALEHWKNDEKYLAL